MHFTCITELAKEAYMEQLCHLYLERMHRSNAVARDMPPSEAPPGEIPMLHHRLPLLVLC
jgi:hypothetical protein